MPYLPIEETEVYKQFTEISDEIWEIVIGWDGFVKGTIGKQLVRAIDSAPANMVEGDARGTDPDAIRFFTYSRGSAREARDWIRRAMARKLLETTTATRLTAAIEDATKGLNGIIRYRRNSN